MDRSDDGYGDGRWICGVFFAGFVALAIVWVWLIATASQPGLVPIVGVAAGACFRGLIYNTPKANLPDFLQGDSCLMAIAEVCFWPFLAWAAFFWMKKAPA